MSSRLATLSLLSLATAACGLDADVDAGPPPSEHGLWGVTQAFRDGRETHMIDVAYFEFDTAAGTLTTDFTGRELVLPYVRDEGGIVTPDNRYFERMDFATLTDSTLQVTTNVQGYFFRIGLEERNVREDRDLVTPE